MNPEQYRRTRNLFDSALQRPRDTRRSFLEQACGTDVELLDRVERLLVHAGPDESAEPLAPVRETAAVGTAAADFDLPCTSGTPEPGRVALADLRGRWLVLVFYPRDFSLICPTELTALSDRIEEFRETGAEILGVSIDSVESHERWLATPRNRGGLGGLNFRLASDEGGAVSRAYGVYLEALHVALRGVFVIDPNGVLQYKAVHNLSIGRRADDLLRVMFALQTGGLCAEGWTSGAPTLDPARDLQAGNMVSHYKIEQCIGTGAFGSVFRAQDQMLERTVALKVIDPESHLPAGAVLAEARAAAALSHPNVCTVFAVDDSEGIPFIAMEYVDGETLSTVLEGAPLGPGQVADIAGQIASGMAAAHAMGISHGDLKPANVIVRGDGVVKILDFGLALQRTASADGKATVIARDRGLRGTPSYMAPEQAAGGRATAESDIFALGVMLFEALTGKPAFSGETISEILDQVQAVDPQALSTAVSEPFASILRDALAAEPGDRSITMQEVADRLGPGTKPNLF